MSKGSWVGTGSSVEIIAADVNRNVLTIQSTDSTQVALGFGEAAVAGEGIQLINSGDSVRVDWPLAAQAVYVIGDGGAGTYQSGLVTYNSGPQVAS